MERFGNGPAGGPSPASSVSVPDDWRMLVPVIRAQTAGSLLQVADALSAGARGGGLVLGLVEVPRRGVEDLVPVLEERRRDLLRWIASVDHSEGGPRLAVGVRVSYDVPRGIREAVYETGSNLIVVEWPGLGSRRPRLLAAVLGDLTVDPPADLVLVRPDTRAGFHNEGAGAALGRASRTLVAVRGGPHSALAVQVAVALARSQGTRLTVLNVLSAHHHPRRRAAQAEHFWRLVADLPKEGVELVQRTAESPGDAILEAARGHRTVVLGAQAGPSSAPALVRDELATTVRLLSLRRTLVLTRRRRAGRRLLAR